MSSTTPSRAAGAEPGLTAGGGQPALQARSLSKSYRSPVLRDLDLDIEQGQFVAIMGPSGSGKSTLLRLITRELLPTRGNLFVNDSNLRKMRTADIPYYRKDVGLVAQDFKLIPHLTVYENIAFVMEAMAVPPKIANHTTLSPAGTNRMVTQNSRMERPREIRARNMPTKGLQEVHQAQ